MQRFSCISIFPPNLLRGMTNLVQAKIFVYSLSLSNWFSKLEKLTEEVNNDVIYLKSPAINENDILVKTCFVSLHVNHVEKDGQFR